jgi:sialate O-acetylesterase
VNDVLVGEVWLCGGQSNMEWMLKDAQDGAVDVAASEHPQIRHIKIAHRTAYRPQDDIEPASWQQSSPTTAGNFSAVAYHFALKLHQELGVPIGLVNVSWGATNIETWLSRDAMHADSDLRAVLRVMPETDEVFSTLHRARMLALVQKWQAGFTDNENADAWKDVDHPDGDWQVLNAPAIWETQGLDGFDGKLWYRREIMLDTTQVGTGASLHLGMVDDCDETFVNGQKVGGLCGWDTQRRYELAPGLLRAGRNIVAVRVTDTGGGGGFHGDAANMKLVVGSHELSLAGPWKARIESPLEKKSPTMNDLPTLSFNGMINPVVGFGIRGTLWYQGESNVPRAAQYDDSFRLLIKDWRQRWGQGDFPFLYVQLAAFLRLDKNTLVGSTWAELREAQRNTLAVANTGMAVAADIGNANDIHPRNKRDVGLRLARIALKKSYGGRAQAGGPMLISRRIVGSRIELRFANAAQGLVVKGGRLKGFTIADGSRKFREAEAHLKDRRTVIVGNADIHRPCAVRFGWVDNPEEDNLFNSAGLPASPFRTDSWPRLTEERLYAF